MSATIIRRLERAERAIPAAHPCRRFVFMPAGCDEAAFVVRAQARSPGAEILAVETFEGDLRDDATAALVLVDAITRHPCNRSFEAGDLPPMSDLEIARRIAFAAAMMRRETLA